MDNLNQPQDECVNNKRRVTGAVRRRFLWWVRQGKYPEEATLLALKPFSELPEYSEIKNLKDAQKAKKEQKSAKFKRDLGTDYISMGIKAKPPMSEKQIEVLKEYILKCIRGREYEGEGPHFCGCYSRCDIFIMKYADEHTINWVTTIFPKLEPWEQAKLTLLNEREIKSEISMFFRRRQSKQGGKTNLLDDNTLSENDELAL